MGLAAGCATTEVPEPDLSQGWTVRQGQAVWFPNSKSSGLAGELIVATNSAGDFMIEFAKPPLSIVEARRIGRAWTVSYGMADRTFSGRGSAPGRIGWLHLVPALEGERRGWMISHSADGWTVANPKTGERWEGYLEP